MSSYGDHDRAFAERVVALEHDLAGLDRLIRTEQESNRRTIDKALTGGEGRLTALEKAHAELAALVVPRGEVQARLDNILGALQALERTLTEMRSQLTGAEEESDRVRQRRNQNRTIFVAAMGVIVAIVSALIIYSNNHGSPRSPTTTTTKAISLTLQPGDVRDHGPLQGQPPT